MKSIAKKIAVCLFTLAALTNCGKKGDTGPAGKDGNANVKSSPVILSNWTYQSPFYYATISWPSITQDIIDNGAVLVYLKTNTSTYSQLPLTLYPSATYSETYEVISYVGGVQIHITDSDLTQPATPGSLTFKVVAIAASTIKANPNVDWKNYQQVRTALKLRD